jgi:competence protein ComEC
MPGLSIALLALAAGATLLQWQPALPLTAVWLAGAISAAIAAIALHWVDSWSQIAGRRRAPFSALFIGLLIVATAGTFGFGYAAWRAETRLADELPSEWEGVDIAVVGIIDELPQSTARGTRFAFAVERIETPGAIVPARLSLAWYSQWKKDVELDLVPSISAGERWRLTVRLKRPHGTVNPHGFDIEAWLLENDLRATGYVRKDSSNARLDAFAGRPSDWIERAREKIRSRILAALPDAQYAGVIVALTIGDQRAISESEWRVFNRTGVTHLVSIK